MTHTFEYEHGALDGLPQADRELVEAAREAARGADAPFTRFRVGAAARMRSGKIVGAANLESAIGALSVCAERNLLYGLHPEDPVEAMAVVSDGVAECYPCGVCRQQMVEFELRQGAPIRVIMAGRDTATTVDSARVLLPFTYIF